jgi:two-component system KDP operon response regulator KdpE
VVDDEASIRQLLDIELSGGGFEVFQAADGETAVRLTSDERPDLLLVDYGLPDMDGDELIHHLRAVSTAPLVVISGYTDSAHRDAAMAAGATAYLAKPFDGEAVVGLCQSLLGAG